MVETIISILKKVYSNESVYECFKVDYVLIKLLDLVVQPCPQPEGLVCQIPEWLTLSSTFVTDVDPVAWPGISI